MIVTMNSWKEFLSQALHNSRRPAMVGVGQELRGDDAAGILVLRRLQQAFSPSDGEDTDSPRGTLQQTGRMADSKKKKRAPAPFLFEAGSLPEAAAGPLRRLQPDWVVFIDAADMGEAPGSVRWIDPDQLSGTPLGTHTFPMSGFSDYLESELGCRVAILGIQPKRLDFDAPVSEEVAGAIEEIAAEILARINKVVE